jgi:cytochrome c5
MKRLVNLSLAITAMMAVFASLPLQADAVPPGTNDDIRERLAPFGNLCRAGDDCGTTAAVADTGPLSGEDVYNQFCFACHATGASDAPIFADVEAWAPRIAKGMDELMNSTINGIGMMPAKGTCMNCSDDDLQAAVDYMVESSQ